MTPTIISAQPNKNLRMLLLAGLAFVGFYLYFGYVPFIAWVAGILLIIVFVYRLVTGEGKGPVIVLNDQGVLDKRLRVGVIRWGDIRRIRSHDVEGATYISLELHDTRPYEARRPLWLKLLSQVQRVHGMSSTSISTVGLDMDHDSLVAMLHEGCEEVGQRNAEMT